MVVELLLVHRVCDRVEVAAHLIQQAVRVFERLLHVEVLLRNRHQHVFCLHFLEVLAHIVGANVD